MSERRGSSFASSLSKICLSMLAGRASEPEQFNALVEATCPGSKLSSFARQQRQDWEAFGNDSGLFKVTDTMGPRVRNDVK